MEVKLPFGLTGIWGWVIVGLVALGLVASIVLGVKGCKQMDADADNQLINSGVTKERDAAKTEVINNVEQARDAAEHPTPAERNSVCAKYDRNCQNGQ